jgi:hypothetical protein
MEKTFTRLMLCCLTMITCIVTGLTETLPACAAKADGKSSFPPAMAEKKFTGIVNCMHRGIGTNSLLVLDDTFLFDLDTTTFKRKIIQIRGEKDHVASLWKPKNFAVSADRKRILVLDKVINTESRKVEVALDTKSALAKGIPSSGLPCPEAFSISPNGRLGLVCVHSYSSDEFDGLALFDMETGKMKHVRRNANTIRYAVFCSDDQVAVFYTNGVISLQTPDGKETCRLSDIGPIPVPWGNNAIIVHSSMKTWLAVCGGGRLAVFDLISQKRIFEDTSCSNPSAALGKSLLVYETVRPSRKLCGCGKHELMEVVLKCRDLRSNGMLEIVMPKECSPIYWDWAAEVIYCADLDSLLKMPLIVPAKGKSDQKMSNEAPEDATRKLAKPQR